MRIHAQIKELIWTFESLSALALSHLDHPNPQCCHGIPAIKNSCFKIIHLYITQEVQPEFLSSITKKWKLFIDYLHQQTCSRGLIFTYVDGLNPVNYTPDQLLIFHWNNPFPTLFPLLMSTPWKILQALGWISFSTELKINRINPEVWFAHFQLRTKLSAKAHHRKALPYFLLLTFYNCYFSIALYFKKLNILGYTLDSLRFSP